MVLSQNVLQATEIVAIFSWKKILKEGKSICFLCLSCCGMKCKMGSGLWRGTYFPFDRKLR